MDKIDTEIRFAGMAEERLRREDPHYRVWSFTDDDDVTALYLGRVDMNGEPVERYDRTPVRGRPPCRSVDRRVEEKSGNEYLESPVG